MLNELAADGTQHICQVADLVRCGVAGKHAVSAVQELAQLPAWDAAGVVIQVRKPILYLRVPSCSYWKDICTRVAHVGSWLSCDMARPVFEHAPRIFAVVYNCCPAVCTSGHILR